MKKLRMWFNRYILPRWIILVIDLITVVLSCVLAFTLRHSIYHLLPNLEVVGLYTAMSLLFAMVSFYAFKPYAGVLRYSSFVDMGRIFIALCCSNAATIFTLLLMGHLNFPIVRVSTALMGFFIMTFGMMAGRILIKLMMDRIKIHDIERTRVLIYGAKEAGVSIAKSLPTMRGGCYNLIGFIADEPQIIGKILVGAKVYPNDEQLIALIQELEIDAIIVSPAKMEQLQQTQMVDRLSQMKIKFLAAPPVSEWDERNLSSHQLRNIKIEDLLQRPPIQTSKEKLIESLEGKRILITGAAGSIGSEIVRQLATFNPFSLILVDQAETPLHDMRLYLQEHWSNLETHTLVADIRNRTRMEAIFSQYQPQYVFHAAAYKHVPMMEDNVSESIQTNVIGSRIIADLASKYQVQKFVMVSTDKAVNPTNVMGCSKRLAEIYIQSLAKKLARQGGRHTQYITTRFGNVLGSNGSVIPRFTEQIAKGGPVTVTHPDIIRYFMTIPEACNLVLEAGVMGHNGEIYVFDMGDPVKILDLARRMIFLSGAHNIKIEFTGLRHGEKLYEELLNVKESTKPTHHDKIMIASVREYDYDTVVSTYDQLSTLSFSYDAMAIVKAMKTVVPEFKSKNSPYEVLDEGE